MQFKDQPGKVFLLCAQAGVVSILNFLQKLCHIQHKRVLLDHVYVSVYA